jgi:hypothetical protein
MGLEDKAAHAALHRHLRGIEHIDGADRAAGAGRIRVEMQMDVDGADKRGVGETEIDRPAQRIDLPFLRRGRLRDARANRAIAA